jgi:peptidoglycan hydrolase-like protein with peptidoglycan-binding domain
MKTWIMTGAVLVAGAMLASPAVAQTTTPSAADKPKSGATTPAGKAETGKSGTMKSGGAAAESGRMSGGKMAAGKEHVKAVQQALKDKGHDPGAVDGVMGPKTQAALKEFQSKEGIKESGRLDAETMSKLGVQARSGAAAESPAGSSPSASPSTSAPSSSAPSSGSPAAAPKTDGTKK